MTTPNQQDMLDKIRALLAKAESTKFPEEAKAFTAKAQELMTKYSIDDAMLNAGKEDYGSIDGTDVWIPANEYRAPKVQLLTNVAAIFDCKLVVFRQTYRVVDGVRKRMFYVKVIGFEKDRDFSIRLWTSLLLQSEQELLSPAILARMQQECSAGGHSIRWRNSFMMAYGSQIYYRLLAAKRTATAQASMQYDGNTMAVVFVGRKALVDRKYAEMFPELGKASKSHAGQGMGSASRLGHEAGSRADLGTGKVKGGTGGLIGG
jgi:hypothetical protein